MNEVDKKVAIITGSSSGIGHVTAIALARNNYFTYATMRDTQKSSELKNISNNENLNLKTLEIDVNKQETIDSAIKEILQEKGRIDVLINNAGSSILGSLEDLSIDEIKQEFETNLFGSIRMIKAVLPIMRKQKSGIIVNISSILGRTGMPLLSGYVSTKFALEGISECLRYELENFGIRVTMIEPGTVNTKLHENLRVSENAKNSIYKEMTEQNFQQSKILFERGIDPTEISNKILEILPLEKPLPRYTVGELAKRFSESMKRMSDSEFENFVKEIYAEIMSHKE